MGKISREKFKVHEGVFDEFTLKTLEMMKRKHYFDELGKAIKTGKEGDVYFAYRGEKTLAIKIYRMTSANFKKISQYIIRDYRFRNIKGSLRKVILVWAEKEFRNVALCHKHNISVPYMYKQFNNIIVMDYIYQLFMGNTTSTRKVNFEDVQHSMRNNSKFILINTLNSSRQDVLIKNTIPINKEEELINTLIKSNQNVNIIVYDENANAPNLMKKYDQLIGLGFINVFIYPGGLFEWLLLQDIYGYENFPTTKHETDIIKFKGKSIFNNYYLTNDID